MIHLNGKVGNKYFYFFDELWINLIDNRFD